MTLKENEYLPVHNGGTNDAESADFVPQDTLTVTDDRTGKKYVVPITNNAIPATAFKEMKAPENVNAPADMNENGIRVFDPGFQNTAVKKSTITYMLVRVLSSHNTHPLC